MGGRQSGGPAAAEIQPRMDRRRVLLATRRSRARGHVGSGFFEPADRLSGRVHLGPNRAPGSKAILVGNSSGLASGSGASRAAGRALAAIAGGPPRGVIEMTRSRPAASAVAVTEPPEGSRTRSGHCLATGKGKKWDAAVQFAVMLHSHEISPPIRHARAGRISRWDSPASP